MLQQGKGSGLGWGIIDDANIDQKEGGRGALANANQSNNF